MPKIIVYTAICGGKDKLRDDILVFSEFSKFKDPVYNAKIYKIMPHKFIDCDISIWVDGNILLNVPPEQLVEECLGDADIALFKHPHRESIHWEMKWIEYQFRNSPDSPIIKDCREQFEHYKSIGFPRKTGVYNCGFMIRRHNKLTEQFNEKWWVEITRWSARDQLSFPVILREFPEIKVKGIVGDIRKNPYLTYTPHIIPS